jgi:hypothetical protein
LYLKPLEPGGLPSAFQPLLGSDASIDPAPPPTVSKISSWPPLAVGSAAGRGKVVPVRGFATIFARMPGLTM